MGRKKDFPVVVFASTNVDHVGEGGGNHDLRICHIFHLY